MRLLDCEVADNLCKSPAYSPQPSSLIPVSKRLDHDFFFLPSTPLFPSFIQSTFTLVGSCVPAESS